VTTFLLIRHGQTDAVGHHLAGVAPGTHLNDEGRAQTLRLVERLHCVPLAAVASSPLERTMETAVPVARDHHLDVEPLPAFLEYDVGAWTGATFAALESDAAWQRFNTMRSTSRPERGELMLEVQTRSVAALLDLRRRYTSGNVAVFSHGDVIRAMLLFVLGMPIDFFNRIEILPARITVVEFGEDAPRVLLVNGDSATGVV
jgi:broad specificity phosphatase PhoE